MGFLERSIHIALECDHYLGEEAMKKHVTALLIVSSAILLIAGCGGGGGGSDTVELCLRDWDYWMADTLNPPTSSNLEDTYDLIGFDIEFWEDGVLVFTMDEEDVPGYSGTLDIQPATITQTITMQGESNTLTGSYTVSIADTTSGTLHITYQFESSDIDFDISGNTLTTDTGLNCFDIPADQLGIEPLEAGVYNSIGSLLGYRFMY